MTRSRMQSVDTRPFPAPDFVPATVFALISAHSRFPSAAVGLPHASSNQTHTRTHHGIKCFRATCTRLRSHALDNKATTRKPLWNQTETGEAATLLPVDPDTYAIPRLTRGPHSKELSASSLDTQTLPAETQATGSSSRRPSAPFRGEVSALASETLQPEPRPIVPLEAEKPRGFGLRKGVLSPAETLAQSVSAIAPTTTPAMTIPLVFAMAGNGTWLVYVLATAAMTLIGVLIGCFARRSASPGSLYKYVTESLPDWASGLAGWALLLAYIATAASVTGGFAQYANVLCFAATGKTAPVVLLVIAAILIASIMAWRDIRLSARSMLWLEAASVACILAIVALILVRHGFRIDTAQFRLRGTSVSGMRLGMVLALFSFVGFESATALGEEARNPLRTIPRAVLQSAIGLGALFVICAYAEVLGFRGLKTTLDQSGAPFHILAQQVGVSVLGTAVDVGATLSMFACVLACITAAARVLLLMSHHGLAHARLTSTHRRNETPHVAVIVTTIATLILTLILAMRGVAASDIYAWMGSLATYGFLTVYALVCLAVPGFLRRRNALTPAWTALAAAGCIAMLLAIAGSLYPVPQGPWRWLPYIYLAYLAAGWLWTVGRNRADPVSA